MINVGASVKIIKVDDSYESEYETPQEKIIGEIFKVIRIIGGNDFPYVLDSKKRFDEEFTFSSDELKLCNTKMEKLKKKLMGGSDGN